MKKIKAQFQKDLPPVERRCQVTKQGHFACPSAIPVALPGGIDGVEPAKDVAAMGDDFIRAVCEAVHYVRMGCDCFNVTVGNWTISFDLDRKEGAE